MSNLPGPIRIRLRCIALILLAISFPLHRAGAQGAFDDGIADELRPPKQLEADDAVIDVGGYAAPFLADLNGDGKKDLLVGQLDHGRLRIYPNVGTTESPRWGKFSWLEANGHAATVPTGCAVGFTPQVIDYDRDGHLDILTGSFYGAACFVFRGRGTGEFEEGVPIVNANGHVQLLPKPGRLQYNSTVFAHDWDKDRDLDLIVGKSRIHVVFNDGTSQEPIYRDAERLKFGDTEIPHSIVPPVIADWNGDGRDDLIAARDKDIVWYRGVGMHGFPDFDNPQILVSERTIQTRLAAPREEDQEIKFHRIYSVCVTDYNGDDRLDLLVGDHFTVAGEFGEEIQNRNRATLKRKQEFWSTYRDLVLADPNDLTREQRIAEFGEALRQWSDVTTGPVIDGPGIDGQGVADARAILGRYEVHGTVWMFERR